MANAGRRRQTGPESPKRTSTVNMAMLLVPQTAAAFPEGALRFGLPVVLPSPLVWFR